MVFSPPPPPPLLPLHLPFLLLFLLLSRGSVFEKKKEKRLIGQVFLGSPPQRLSPIEETRGGRQWGRRTGRVVDAWGRRM